MNTKPVIGLMGAIGSGKSAVASAFGQLGCAIIDADKMALDLLEKKDRIDTISEVFGGQVLNPDGSIDRKKLADEAFSDPASLEQLNSILHPTVLSQTQQLIDRYRAAPEVSAIVLDVPLLMETGWHTRCNVLVFIESLPEIRIQRVTQKGRFSADQIKKREKFQISLDKKREIAHYIIQNNSDLAGLTDQVARIYSAIMKVWG
jgi:dephospho-CoA kinase